MKGGAQHAPRYRCRALEEYHVGWVMSGRWHLALMMEWKGEMPKSCHHRGLARCKEKGKKEWSGREGLDLEDTPCRSGGGGDALV